MVPRNRGQKKKTKTARVKEDILRKNTHNAYHIIRSEKQGGCTCTKRVKSEKKMWTVESNLRNSFFFIKSSMTSTLEQSSYNRYIVFFTQSTTHFRISYRSRVSSLYMYDCMCIQQYCCKMPCGLIPVRQQKIRVLRQRNVRVLLRGTIVNRTKYCS